MPIEQIYSIIGLFYNSFFTLISCMLRITNKVTHVVLKCDMIAFLQYINKFAIVHILFEFY